MMYDIFFSYPHADKDEVMPICSPLQTGGLDVWIDKTKTKEGESITKSTVEGLAQSKVLLAYYSPNYPRSRACQWEMTAAFIAAQHEEKGRPERRIRIIKPKGVHVEIHPVELQDALYHRVPVPVSPDEIRGIVKSVKAHAKGITGVFGDIGALRPAEWYGRRREAACEGQIRQIATTLGITVEGRNPDEIEVAVRLELGRRGEPFLWVVDDLPSGTDRDTFESWLAPHSLGKTLITTRAREHDALGTLIPLDVLEPEEAYELLTSRQKPKVEGDRGRRRRGVDEKDEESAACSIVEALGCHALAVDVAGTALYVSSSRTPFVTFLEDLADPTDDELEFAAELAETLPTGHEASIARTFLKSIDRLEPEGLDFLRLASRLAVAQIPATLISSVFSEVDSLNERSGGRRAARAVNKVERLSLAERVEGDEGAWSVHTLISRTMRFRDPEPERSEELRDAAVEVLTTAFRENADDPRDHAALEPVVAHARDLVNRVDDLETADLASWIARYDYVRGAYKAAEKLQCRVCGIRRRVLGSEHSDTLVPMSDLALTRSQQGELAGARKIQEEVFEIMRRVLGKEHPDMLAPMNNLAVTLHAQGDLDGARKIQEEVLETRRGVLGSEHPDTLTSMNNLATILSYQGELARARKIHEEVLEITRRILGKEHPDMLASMNNLAVTLHAQGDLDGARKIQEEVLVTRRWVLGKEHPDTSISAWNLFCTLRDMSDSDSARTVLETDLLWLLDRDPASLGAHQRKIREMVCQITGRVE